MGSFPASYDYPTPVPVPQDAVASGPPITVSQEAAKTQAVLGQQIEGLSQEVDRYGLHIDTMSAQQALNKLRTTKDDLTFGAENGFMNTKGLDVLNKAADGTSFMDSNKNRFQIARDAIGSGLNARAALMFQTKADEETSAYGIELARHSIQQTEVANKSIYTDTTTQTLADAARYSSDPAKLDELAARASKAAQNYAIHAGLKPDAMMATARSGVYTIAIKSLLDNGAQRQALAYFDSVKDKLDGNAQVALAKEMKGVSSDLVGEQAANTALARTGLPQIPTDDPSAGRTYNAVLSGGESGGRYDIPNAMGSGAFGKYQFMPQTWATVANSHPDLGLPFDMRKATPAQQEAAQRAFTSDNAAALKGAGIEPSPTNLALAHWVGAEGARKILTANPAASVGDILGKDALEKNPGLRTTAGALIDSLKQRYAGVSPTSGAGDDGTAPVAFKGDLKAGYEKAAYEVSQRTDLNKDEKAKAFAYIVKQSSQITAYQAAMTKSLDDQVSSTFGSVLVNPALLKEGTFQGWADQYRALGSQSEATRYQLLASMEGWLKNGLQSGSDAQIQMLKELAPAGLPKQIVEGYLAGNRKQATELSALGAEKFAQVKKSIESDNVQPSGVVATAKEAFDHYTQAGKPEEARKISDYMTSALNAEKLVTGPSSAAAQSIADLTAHADRSEADMGQLQTLSIAKHLFDQQKGLLNQDSFKNGATIYAKDVGPVPALDPANLAQSLASRSVIARRIEQLSGVTTIPFANEEITQFRADFDGASPDKAAVMMQGLGRALPPDMIPHVAAAIAGKGEGDRLSRSYAAALSFFSENDPASNQIGMSILRGADVLKTNGGGVRKPAETSDPWLQSLQDKLGNVFVDVSKKVPAVIADAVAAVYVDQMYRSGRQGEKVDDTVLESSIKSVMGETVTRNDQAFLPPRGVDSYAVDGALRSLTDGDFADVRTLNGSPVTADKVIRWGQITNAGQEGKYFVRIPDPANGNAPGYVTWPDGKPYILDLKPLMQRAQMFPPGFGNEDQGYTGMRRRPVVPTLNDVTP